ncbi:hypothetical protein [Streptomyces halobius]|uniref:Uncharacterized protein n=1 Tax=Streptomyces halobius TaxID=2879846 RepID=A0ABY4M3X9_9ACTN|nr:hypothetical protein [Streptomyces halobius]UQA91096.1 hypothetical protein K9S39_03640 [Streptomyces halobius]
MDEGKEDVHQRGAGEHAVGHPEHGSQHPAAVVDGDEQTVVAEGEDQPGCEVEYVAECFGAGAIGGEDGAEQERDVDELVRGPQRCGEDAGADETARQRGPHTHRRSCWWSAQAALINAR